MLITDTMVIHGGGYVGLTAAVHYASNKDAWGRVVIYDPDPAVVAGIMSGFPRSGEFLGYLDSQIRDLVFEGRIQATTNFELVRRLHYHTIAVPTERANQPYGKIVVGVLRELFKTIPRLGVILVESTLAPGMIDGVLKERPNYCYLAVCPRRDWFADSEKNVSNLERIIGGVNWESSAMAFEIISTVTRRDLIHKTDRETAEICKALENALLHIPVMFAHQLACVLPQKNVREALRLAGTHWRLPQYHIGFGTGGRCVPIGTKYLLQATKGLLPIANAAIIQEATQREYVCREIRRHLNGLKGTKRVVVLGAGYRPNFKDIGGSPGVDIARMLFDEDWDVILHDPLWDPIELEKATGVPSGSVVMFDHREVVLLATEHDAYKVIPNRWKWNKRQLILDAHGAWSTYRSVFKVEGADYRIVGEPGWRKP